MSDEVDQLLPWLSRAREAWLPRAGKAEPLVLRAWLSGPLATYRRGEATIEGPLQHAVVIAASGAHPGSAFAGFPDDAFADVPIPVADVVTPHGAIACASWPRRSPDARETGLMLVHKPEAEQLASRVVYITGGEAKPKRAIVPTVAATWLEWDLLADRERLLALLPGVRALGKFRGGLGSVDRWEVIPSRDDRSLVRDGSPARALPVADEAEAMERFAAGYVLDMQTTRAPYWHQSTRRLVACPPC